MSYRLGKIKRDVPVDIDFDKCRLDLYDDREAAEQFEKLGFTSLLDHFDFKEEASFEELDVKELTAKNLNNFKEKAVEAGEIAAALKLEKGSKAIDGKIKEFVFALKNKAEIYFYQPEAEIDLNIREILESEKIEKLMLNAKDASLALYLL